LIVASAAVRDLPARSADLINAHRHPHPRRRWRDTVTTPPERAGRTSEHLQRFLGLWSDHTPDTEEQADHTIASRRLTYGSGVDSELTGA
jgi:hypothetical protein